MFSILFITNWDSLIPAWSQPSFHSSSSTWLSVLNFQMFSSTGSTSSSDSGRVRGETQIIDSLTSQFVRTNNGLFVFCPVITSHRELSGQCWWKSLCSSSPSSWPWSRLTAGPRPSSTSLWSAWLCSTWRMVSTRTPSTAWLPDCLLNTLGLSSLAR